MNSRIQRKSENADSKNQPLVIIDGFEDDDFIAVNYDGTEPRVKDGFIYVKELWCPPECGCGGCQTVISEYPIGENKDDGFQYYWKEI